jgi:hypothetical protein
MFLTDVTELFMVYSVKNILSLLVVMYFGWFSYQLNACYAVDGAAGDDGGAHFKVYNDTDRDIWVRVKVLAPDSFRTGRHEHVLEQQIQRVRAHSASEDFHRGRYCDLSYSVWADEALTRPMIRYWGNSIGFAGICRINVFDWPRECVAILSRDFTGLECPICLSRDDDQDIIVFYCGHKMHYACARDHLEHRGQCPICRCSVSAGRRGRDYRIFNALSYVIDRFEKYV